MPKEMYDILLRIGNLPDGAYISTDQEWREFYQYSQCRCISQSRTLRNQDEEKGMEPEDTMRRSDGLGAKSAPSSELEEDEHEEDEDEWLDTTESDDCIDHSGPQVIQGMMTRCCKMNRTTLTVSWKSTILPS
jgi:hypothetical protein